MAAGHETSPLVTETNVAEQFERARNGEAAGFVVVYRIPEDHQTDEEKNAWYARVEHDPLGAGMVELRFEDPNMDADDMYEQLILNDSRLAAVISIPTSAIDTAQTYMQMAIETDWFSANEAQVADFHAVYADLTRQLNNPS